ncbi:MAG TPA: hypothetical protein VFS32_05735 [Candidatus Limnocylindrales bacterium]|nr:hypothetical protein [Candidatus Limnocylindrales bacterium]
MTAERTVALGGERTVPVPDPIAAEYLLLALRLGQRIEGLVDGYFGPADLKARTDMESLPAPASLVADAERLRERAAAGVAEADRRDWLDRQIVALETHARRLAGERLSYVEELRRLFDWQPQRREDALFDEAAARVDGILPGPGSVAERLAAWDGGLTVPEARLASVVEWLLAEFRRRAEEAFGLPDGESLTVRFVRDRPWGCYNWYDGGLRSRVEINLDLPVRVTSLVPLLAHEAYPGHHLEHAWKEADLVDRRGRLEGSILLLNAPECVISEGLADLGRRFAVPAESEIELLAEAVERAGVPAAEASGASSARELAERAVAVAGARHVLDDVAVNAALLRHADGRSHDETLAYLVDVGRMAPERAAKRLEFIEHPVTRSYVFVYSEGEALLARWLEAVPEADRAARFGRLLHEQLTPSAIAAEVAAQSGEVVSAPTTTR